MAPVTPSSVVANLEQDLTADWRHYHVQAHLVQFAALYVAGMGTALAAAGWHVAGWAALGGLGLSVAGATVRQLWPQVPWSVVKAALADAAAAVERPAPPSAG